MNFSNDKHFLTFHNKATNPDVEGEKEPTREEVLNSNDVELVVKYAKENRSQEAIDKARELLELSRRTGEELVQNFLSAFKECEAQKINYLNFENTASGRLALDSLEKMPEPFKAAAYKKLADYKEELAYNTELLAKHQNNQEKIWKEVFGFDYYKVPDFKERFKTFLFQDIKGIAPKYYKKNSLELVQDPFALNFFVEDPENFNRAYNEGAKDADDKFGGFSKPQNKTTVNVINVSAPSPEDGIRRKKDEIITHEAEHALHRKINPINAALLEPDVLETWMDFNHAKERLNYAIKFDFQERLKKAKDELFAYFKGGAEKEEVEQILLDKSADASYDYNKEIRRLNHESINSNQNYSEVEKQKLKDAINFLQSEYDKVLNHMAEVIYENNQSVEFLRNVPINELWKYSNGKYNRLDFIIRDFKF